MNDNNNENIELNTKTRSTKKILIINFIAIILVVAIGILMVGIYPKIKEAGKNNSISFSYYNNDFSSNLSKSSYVLYKDALETMENKYIDANDIYIKSELKTKDSNEYEVIKENLNEHLNVWSSELTNEYQNIDYVVLDKDNNVIKSNTGNNINTLLNSNDITNNYLFYLSIKFDENGNMILNKIYGVNETAFRDTFLHDLKLNHLFYTDNYQIDRPFKNMTFIYGINKDLKHNDRCSQMIEQGQEESYFNIMSIYVLILGGIVLFLSLCIPLKLEMEISICKKAFKIPFEILVTLIGSIVFIMCIGTGKLALYTLNGEFATKGLTQIGIDPYTGNIVVYISNVIYWSLFATLIFIIIVTLKNIFSIGLFKYFKEKTLTGIIIRFIKRNVQKICRNIDNAIHNIDLNDKSNKFIIKIVAIDAAAIFAFFIVWCIGTLLSRSLLFSGFLGILLAFIYCIIMFNLLKQYVNKIKNKYEVLFNTTNKIAEGSLDVNINEDLGLFNPFKEQLVKIQKGFKKAVDEEVKSQKMKTELISNVSHDLKTPLTSIITYVDLLKGENVTEEERKSYIYTLDKKSQRLKFLIEDLFEVSKATSGNITLNLVKVDIVELMKQTQFELEDKIKNANLNIKNNFPKAKIIMELDSQKMFRVFENLLNNVAKYAMEGSRVYIDIIDSEEKAEITIKNMSAEEITFNGFDIVERFQRGDKSRNTEGSGLGLAIVKSFVEAQGGTFNIEIDGDLFKVMIIFNKLESINNLNELMNANLDTKTKWSDTV